MVSDVVLLSVLLEVRNVEVFHESGQHAFHALVLVPQVLDAVLQVGDGVLRPLLGLLQRKTFGFWINSVFLLFGKRFQGIRNSPGFAPCCPIRGSTARTARVQTWHSCR